MTVQIRDNTNCNIVTLGKLKPGDTFTFPGASGVYRVLGGSDYLMWPYYGTPGVFVYEFSGNTIHGFSRTRVVNPVDLAISVHGFGTL